MKKQLQFPHNRQDPDVWTALEVDSSLPINQAMKEAWLKDTSRWTRQFMLPILRPILLLLRAVIQVYKVINPNWLTSSKLFHFVIRNGLKYFVTPEGNYLFLRHFILGSQVLRFLSTNIKGVDIETTDLLPQSLHDIRDDIIIKHDLNLFNFVIDLNLQLKERGIDVAPNDALRFDCLSDPTIRIDQFRRGWTNFIDIQTATDLFTPIFQLLMTDRVFWRSVHSLQLDETIGLYFAKLLDLHNRLFLINNRHPLIPNNTVDAADRLSLHSYSTEVLHGLLMQLKSQHAMKSRDRKREGPFASVTQ